LQIDIPVQTTSKDSFATELIDDGAQLTCHIVAYYSANWRQQPRLMSLSGEAKHGGSEQGQGEDSEVVAMVTSPVRWTRCRNRWS